MRRYIALGDLHPQLVLCSDAQRTRDTLEGLRPALGEGVEVEYQHSLYLAGADEMLERLRAVAAGTASVMLVGHCPAVQDLALRLAGRDDEAERARMAQKFPTGALATLVYRGSSWDALSDGACELHSFVTPSEIGEDPRRRRR